MTGERSIPTLDRAPFFKASTENGPQPHPRSRIVRPESPSSMSRLNRIVLLGDNPFRWYSSQWPRALESKCSLIHFVPSAFSQQAPVTPNSPRYMFPCFLIAFSTSLSNTSDGTLTRIAKLLSNHPGGSYPFSALTTKTSIVCDG